MHLIDLMELHKQTGDMISSTLTNTAMNFSKLQVSLANVQSQLKMEKFSSFSKDTRIKTREGLVIKILVTLPLPQFLKISKKPFKLVQLLQGKRRKLSLTPSGR